MVSPPAVTVDDASKVAMDQFGWQTNVKALTGERDKNYLLHTQEVGDVVLKFINPAEAAEGTIRKKYATSIGENAVHGSDSDENALIEGAFFFSGLEKF